MRWTSGAPTGATDRPFTIPSPSAWQRVGVTPPERSCSRGEPFTPLGRCSIATAFGVYVLEPAVSGGGHYTFVPGPYDPAGAEATLAGAHRMPFTWVRWVADETGPGFRIHIGIGSPSETSVEVTGPVRRIDGEFTTEALPRYRVTRAGARLGRILRFTLP